MSSANGPEAAGKIIYYFGLDRKWPENPLAEILALRWIVFPTLCNILSFLEIWTASSTAACRPTTRFPNVFNG
jgi:hypothetical protein